MKMFEEIYKKCNNNILKIEHKLIDLLKELNFALVCELGKNNESMELYYPENIKESINNNVSGLLGFIEEWKEKWLSISGSIYREDKEEHPVNVKVANKNVDEFNKYVSGLQHSLDQLGLELNIITNDINKTNDYINKVHTRAKRNKDNRGLVKQINKLKAGYKKP